MRKQKNIRISILGPTPAIETKRCQQQMSKAILADWIAECSSHSLITSREVLILTASNINHTAVGTYCLIFPGNRDDIE